MGKTIVMKTTIDHFVGMGKASALNTMMGNSSDWEKVEMENGKDYYVKEGLNG